MYDELEIKEREIDELKKSLNDAQDIYRQKSTSAKSDQDDIEELKNVVKGQRLK